jgi:hypothetical protein
VSGRQVNTNLPIFFSLTIFVAALVSAPAKAPAEVRVAEDEVLFSLSAPGAKDVFLVGDFNNWNPTYEKMEETEGRFEVRLFLLPGSYRYKFVVDGVLKADPDNPPDDPSHGSLLVLVERGGVLMLGSDAGDESEALEYEVLAPSVRYSGAFFVDDGETNSKQALDVWLRHASDRVDAAVDFKSIDDSWDIDPLRAEVLFDRGHMDLKLGEAVFKGFDNDTVWSSSDPFRLVGGVGIWGYNAGFDRRGFSAEVPFIPRTKLRGFYSDTVGEGPGPPLSIDSEAFGGFENSQSPDTLVYRYAATFEDEDVWGVEFCGETGSFDFGYTRRANRGYQPGSLAEIGRMESSFAASLYTTREFWEADVGWLGWNFWRDFSALAGFGRAKGKIQTAARSVSVVDELGGLGIGQAAEAFERDFPAQTDGRWIGALLFETERASARALYSRSDYDFEERVYSASSARVRDLVLDGSYRADRWRVAGSLRYLDQEYGDSPDDFHFSTPQKNAWLDHRDQLTTTRMVSFDLEKSTEFEAVFSWGRRALSSVEKADTLEAAGGENVGATAVLASVGAVSRDFFDAIEYVSLRLAIERTLWRRFFGQWDSRLAHYDKPSWGLEETFFSTYIEGGYRNSWTEVSLGFGFDPVVLDPVVNRYADIGREELLRGALPVCPLRSESALLGEGLRRQEALLEDFGAVKLEIILAF